MRSIIYELKKRNPTLYYFGIINLAGAFLCGCIMLVDHTQIMGINAWIKPMKFYLSTVIYSWTMAWLLIYLNEPKKVRIFNRMVIIVFVFELVYITVQAARGQKSHFNISSPFSALMYSLMGLAITVLVFWTGYFAVLFIKRSFPTLPNSYIWGIRLGLITFVVFSLSAHIMASSTGHSVGAADGSQGLPFVNWSRQYGDLRAAHFFGMHALQLLPLFGFISKNARLTVAFSMLYFISVSIVMVLALQGKPLFN